MIFRPQKGDFGSLCGLGAYYFALESTLLTTSQLSSFDYGEMRKLISSEMGEEDDELITDAEHLYMFYSSNAWLIHTWFRIERFKLKIHLI